LCLDLLGNCLLRDGIEDFFEKKTLRPAIEHKMLQ